MKAVLVVVAIVLVQACSTFGVNKPNSEGVDKGAASEYVAQTGLTAQQRFREVLNFLEDGEPIAARVELMIYLDAHPKSDVARDILRQIDLPSADYFPRDFEEVTLASGQSLSTLSEKYLGSLYQFHALAKFNGIVRPRSIRVGQAIRIPLTVKSREVFSSAPAAADETDGKHIPSLPTRPTVKAVEPEPVLPSSEELMADRADELYRQAVNAFRAQDLDSAIALWDKVLEIDPNYENARLQRSQAVELKRKLSNLN